MARALSYFEAREATNAGLFSKLPKFWQKDVIRQHAILARERGYLFADDWLRGITEPLDNLLNIASDDDDIKKLAGELAFKVREKASFMVSDKAGFFFWTKELCASYAVRYPFEFDQMQQFARLSDEVWWLRNLRNAHARAREVAAINAGLVSRHRDLYVSDDTLERRRQQRRRNEGTLNNIVMQSESGERLTLADIAKTGMANQENRRNELMTRIAGFEALSVKYGHKAIFVTLTCPSKMHATLHNGKANPKYDGTKPDASQKYLVECWARARARLNFRGVRVYGLRVAEPHHDGTPHWHVILFYKPVMGARETIEREIRAPFMDVDGDEAGASKNRVKFVHINPLKGSAAGYVAKYVAKNIGGIEGENSDEANATSESAAERVEAWATTWRIRQFQQIGGHSVTVWRELRRVDESEAQKVGNIFKAWMHAQKTAERRADFAGFIESMGGLDVSMRCAVLATHDDYVTKRGRYGETVVRVIKGVAERFGIGRAKTNREKWERV